MTYLAALTWQIALDHAIRFATRSGRRHRVVKIGPFWAILEDRRDA